MRVAEKQNLIDTVRRSMREDRAPDDVTTRTLFSRSARANAVIVSREAGMLSGVVSIPPVFEYLKAKPRIKYFHCDGNSVKKGSKIVALTGSICDLFAAERTILNFLGHLSGIASLTGQYAEQVKGTKTSIYDTRKTTPGLRELEKYAVRCGGGCNHRYNLGDMVLVKDNHLARTGLKGLAAAISLWKKRKLCVEVEVDSMSLLKDVIPLRPDIIMLDNFSYGAVKAAMRYIGTFGNRQKRPLVEVSGNVGLRNARRIARLGVDRISVGAITHSALNMDFSMEVI